MRSLVVVIVLVIIAAAVAVRYSQNSPNFGWDVFWEQDEEDVWLQFSKSSFAGEFTLQNLSEEGLWINHGYGWLGPCDSNLPLLFYTSRFRLVSIGVSSFPLGNLPVTSKEGQVVGQMKRVLQKDLGLPPVYEITIRGQLPDGWYYVRGTPVFVYPDPAGVIDLIIRGETGHLDGSVGVFRVDGLGAKMGKIAHFSNVHSDLFAQKSRLLRAEKKVETPTHLAIEFRMEDGTFSIFSHWAEYFYLQPMIEIFDGKNHRSESGRAEVNVSKSTNFSVWIDVYLEAEAGSSAITIYLGPKLSLAMTTK